MRPRALVVRTAGITADLETQTALQQAGADADIRHVDCFAREDDPLRPYQLLVFPGGHAHGDEIAPGRLFALEAARAIGDKIAGFLKRGGAILGIDGGFRVLVFTGLLPDARLVPPGDRSLAFVPGTPDTFDARWVRLRAPEHVVSPFVRPGEEIELPVARTRDILAGREAEDVERLHRDGRVAYRFAGTDNPVAALSDADGRIFGILARPERFLRRRQHPRWTRERRSGEGDGLRFFRRVVESLI